jgi:hypothetical protein
MWSKFVSPLARILACGALVIIVGRFAVAIWQGEVGSGHAGPAAIRWSDDPLAFAIALIEMLAEHAWFAIVLIGYLAAEIAMFRKERANRRLAVSLERLPPVDIEGRLGWARSGREQR